MRFASKLAVVAMMSFALSACAPSTTATPTATSKPVTSAAPESTPIDVNAECPPTPIDVTITYEWITDASGGIVIDAASNLPDGSELGASFFVEGGFFAQDESTLENGKVSFGPFSDKGTPLQGSYEMSITLPIARNQPASVRACIGSVGELLTGPLVSTDEITGDNFASLDAIVTIE